MNTFGQLLRLTDFGESHGAAIGGVLDGLPAGLHIDLDAVQVAMERRRPGGDTIFTSRRNEPDKVEWLSGITPEGVTMGSPIAFIIHNKDAHASDYEAMTNIFRPGHADFTWWQKYGVKLPAGGGYASGRRTAVCVVAGALAQQFLKTHHIEVRAFLSGAGPYHIKKPFYVIASQEDIYASPLRCPDPEVSNQIRKHLISVCGADDSSGGVVSFIATGVPAGLGEPPYGKLSVRLTEAMMSINAAKGVIIGDLTSPEEIALARGSEYADQWTEACGKAFRQSNHAGGIEGGISNGESILLTVAFKPTATVGRGMVALDTDMTVKPLYSKGRHDTCIAVRAVSVVEAMGALVLADALLLKAAYK